MAKSPEEGMASLHRNLLIGWLRRAYDEAGAEPGAG